jgi:hypothetical protein
MLMQGCIRKSLAERNFIKIANSLEALYNEIISHAETKEIK